MLQNQSIIRLRGLGRLFSVGRQEVRALNTAESGDLTADGQNLRGRES